MLPFQAVPDPPVEVLSPDKMDEKLQEKEEQRVKEARRKELLASMSKEDKELLGLK